MLRTYTTMLTGDGELFASVTRSETPLHAIREARAEVEKHFGKSDLTFMDTFDGDYLVKFVRGNDPYNFGYKDMDETMGPCESECPEAILKLLTPTKYESAQEWRARCWKNIELAKEWKKKRVPGTNLRVLIDMTNVREGEEFTVEKHGRRVLARSHKQYQLFRMNGYFLNNTEIVTSPSKSE